ncbi:hypothetical protein [Nesterenkonia muleiensis]|uniref:hypothetical protein n=1 Tax=Nesterenkonia muleiensis TaxID=2282648 RepID=UPI00130081BF|nr:hypothetical protein [Nesterenkonia muleiensis]
MTSSPEPTGLTVEENQYLNLLLNHEVAIGTVTSIILVPRCEADDELRIIPAWSPSTVQ